MAETLFDTKKREGDLDRLIIGNRTDMHMIAAMQYVVSAMLDGRISKAPNGADQYCGATTFADGVVVIFVLNEKSDKAIVEYVEKRKDREHFTWDEMSEFNDADWFTKGWEQESFSKNEEADFINSTHNY